jgi:hypothetical protein
MEGAWSVSRLLFGIQKTGIAARQSDLWKRPNPSLERNNNIQVGNASFVNYRSIGLSQY